MSRPFPSRTPDRRAPGTPTRALAPLIASVLALGAACGTGPLDDGEDPPEPGTGDERIVFFTESFEDDRFGSRGWYDNLSPVTSSAEAFAGERSLEIRFEQGAVTPTWGGSMRHEFPPVETVHISYHVRFPDSWVGSRRAYHPHELYLLTTLDERFTGPSTTFLTAYVETNVQDGRIVPVVGLGDRRNIDTSNIGVDLTEVTEARAVAGCNGEADGYPTDCFQAGADAWGNGKTFLLNDTPIERNGWHHVEVLLGMNSVVDGVGVADGIVRYWLDGVLVLDLDDVLLRTGENPGMAFDQLLLGPYIGDGSPVDQVYWLDELEVADRR